jgi:hypothetical protein
MASQQQLNSSVVPDRPTAAPASEQPSQEEVNTGQTFQPEVQVPAPAPVPARSPPSSPVSTSSATAPVTAQAPAPNQQIEVDVGENHISHSQRFVSAY